MSTTSKTQKILVIEGDGVLGDRIVDVLKKDGYSEVSLVKDGNVGFKAITDSMPHLILLDVSLQGSDGYSILAEKQAEPMLAKIPVFLLSAQATPINMRLVPKDSVTEYLVALEMDPKFILDKVNHYFGNDLLVPEVADKDKKKLLWVEDDRLIGSILSRKLIASGFDLLHAKNGDEAMDALKDIKPDVIALDLVLPGMSGFDILQKIRADERLRPVPVLILSNLSKQSDIERAKALGAQKFIVKAAASLDQIVAEVRNLTK